MSDAEAETSDDTEVTPQTLITRFCELQAKVMREVFDYQSANDCFCGERQDWVKDGIWRNEQTSVAWIENVVDEAIRKLWSAHA